MSAFYCFQFLVYSLCINVFVVFTYLIYYYDVYCNLISNEISKEYDYIIVGSGTAGSVIAYLLAETNYTFIVLEAGGHSHSLLDIPIVGPALHGSLFDWQLVTEPQENACWAMEEQRCKLPQGKIIGGSSKLNNMIHFRGNISHYAAWFHNKHTEAYICEHFQFIEENILHLDSLRYTSELADAMLDAAKELGYSELGKEFNTGFAESTVSQKDGKRWATSSNLGLNYVLTQALVTKVLIKNQRAYGVRYVLLGKEYEIFARKSVVISAGAFNSPKLLQLSGIGPAKILNSLGIPVIKNLQVGRNLQDHISTGLDLVLFNQSLSIRAGDIVNPLNLFEYFSKGTGPLTTPGCEVIGFLSAKNLSTPNLQFMVLPVGISSDRGAHLKYSLGIKQEVWDNYFATFFEKHSATILPIILHPISRGEVFISSTDSQKPPTINPMYLSNKSDVEMLTKGLKLVSHFLETKSMKKLGAYLNPTPFPGCEVYPFFGDKYLECYIKHLTLPSYHPVGTCSMGLPGSKNAVVDTSFKVIGVDDLYVVDASVLPTLPSANINAAVAMMASVFVDTVINLTSTMSKGGTVCGKIDWFSDIFLQMCPLI